MKDQISALMDNELDVESSGHLFTALNADSKLGESWALYHMIGDSMRGAPQFSPDFQQRLMRRLEQEPAILAPRRKPIFKPSFTLSAAASVAAVLFVGWMAVQQQARHPADAPVPATVARNNVSPESVNSYLLAHHELSLDNGMQASYYVRPVAYAGNGN